MMTSKGMLFMARVKVMILTMDSITSSVFHTEENFKSCLLIVEIKHIFAQYLKNISKTTISFLSVNFFFSHFVEG